MPDQILEWYFALAGARVKITGNRQELFEDPLLLTPFLTEKGTADRRLHCRIVEAFPRPEGEEVFRDPGRRVYFQNGAFVSYIGAVADSPDGAYIRVERRGNLSDAQFRRKDIQNRIPPRAVLTALEAEHLVTWQNGLLLHASCIEYRGRAILFTAPSGTGKSTQADLWRRFRGARIIHGDRIVVRVNREGVDAVGIPYSGSSGICENAIIPLAAIVYLGQGPDNRISALGGAAAFRRIWEGCSLHFWNREDTAKASETAVELIRRIPVYHFSCTPDENAVLALEAQLKQ